MYHTPVCRTDARQRSLHSETNHPSTGGQDLPPRGSYSRPISRVLGQRRNFRWLAVTAERSERWNRHTRGCILVPMSEVTQILSAIEQGDPSAAEELLPLVYNELRKLAAAKLAKENAGACKPRR